MRMRGAASGIGALGLVTAVVVGGAGPASAKGPTEATVTYPGGQGVRIEPTEVEHMGFGALIEDMAMWSMLDAVSGVPDLAEAPPDGLADDQLGPRYTVTWTMYHGSDEGLELYQHLYPEAPGGAVVYSPGGQPAEPYSQVTTGGWLRSPGDPVATLASLGVDLDAPPTGAPAPGPDPAPAARGTPAARTAGADDGNGAGLPMVAVGGLAVVALAGAGAAVGLRLRGRRAAPAAG
jgi:hypothetical protein